jgi:hypothetical protein
MAAPLRYVRTDKLRRMIDFSHDVQRAIERIESQRKHEVGSVRLCRSHHASWTVMLDVHDRY